MCADFAWLVSEQRFLCGWVSARLAEELETVFGADESRWWVWVFGCWGRKPTIHRRVWRRVWLVVEDASQDSSPNSDGAKDGILCLALRPRLMRDVVFLRDERYGDIICFVVKVGVARVDAGAGCIASAEHHVCHRQHLRLSSLFDCGDLATPCCVEVSSAEEVGVTGSE